MRQKLTVTQVARDGDSLIVSVGAGSIRLGVKGKVRDAESIIKPGVEIEVTLSADKIERIDGGAEVTGTFHGVVGQAAPVAASGGRPRSADH